MQNDQKWDGIGMKKEDIHEAISFKKSFDVGNHLFQYMFSNKSLYLQPNPAK